MIGSKKIAASLPAVVLAMMLVSSVAHAETADELFVRGKALANQHRYDEACPVLAESVKVSPGIGARLWLGECYEKTGRLASALAEFKAAAAQAGTKKDDREKVAKKRVTALESKVPHLLVAAAEGVSLTVDGEPVAAGVADPFDAGLHTIAATAPGFVKWSASVSVPDAPGTVTVNVPALQPEVHEKAPEPIVSAPPTTTQVVVHSPGLGAMRIGAIATGAVGLAALGGGLVMGLKRSRRTTRRTRAAIV